MTVTVFVDTNVIVYSLDASKKAKQERALEWMDDAWKSRRGRVSMQVLQEFYLTVTSKLKPGLDREVARRHVRGLMLWRPTPVTSPLVERAWSVQDRFGFSWGDSMIVAAAHVEGCSYLLTEDLQDGQDLDGLVVLNPFIHAPDTVKG
jgi:predicted nucleic acid-binding protein